MFVKRLQLCARSFFWQPTGCVSSLAELTAPHGVLDRQDAAAAVGETEYSLPVIALADGKVIGDLRLVATRDDVVIGGLQTIFGSDDPASHYALRRRRVRLARHRPGTALLLGAANSDNYYHWLMESLPRWHLLQLAGWQNYDYVLLLNQPRAFQNELLDRLGVSAAKRLHCSKNFIHQFDRLVVPAMPAPPWQARAWACAWLRSLFPQTGGGGPEKIYLSRRDVQRRRLVNEPEIAAQLASRGFVSVQLEQLTVAAQAKLFANARCVVAPHGAGLANLVFAAPGTRVVELFHPDVLTPCYQNLAVAGGLQYAAITGTRVRTRSRHDEQAEFSIEIPALLQTLAEENLLSK